MTFAGYKIILLTGAPLSCSLDWSEPSVPTSLTRPFSTAQEKVESATATQESGTAQWRRLPLDREHLPTGLTQATREQCLYSYLNGEREASFVTATDLSESSLDTSAHASYLLSPSQRREIVLSQYYEHSFAVHETSTQILGTASFESALTEEIGEHSFLSEMDPLVEAHAQLTTARLHSGVLSDLKDLPNARHLHSINPQTMTVNLVVGVISISPPRTITTRKLQQKVDLVELLVGDETRSGFGINIWLPVTSAPDSIASSDRHETDGSLTSQTLRLRPQDIVLVRNIALGSFRDKVDGQSLRRGMTSLDLLYRNMVDADDFKGAFSAREIEKTCPEDSRMDKVKRVKDWVMHFVGTKMKPSKDMTSGTLLTLPLDTQ